MQKTWAGVADSIKTELAHANSNAAGLVDELSSATNSAVSAVSNVAGLSSSDFNMASALKSALDTGASGLNSAVNGVSTAVNYVADANVTSTISDSVSWLGGKISEGSADTFNGLDWLTNKLGIDLNLNEFDGVDGFLAGFIAYVVGYKYAGANDLHGGAGNDTFYSGMGNDDLRGGSGTDTYVMSIGDGHDTIYEEAGGNDILKISANRLFSSIAMSADKVKVNIADGDMIINYVDGSKSYAAMTIDDYAHVNIKELDLVDTAGHTVATLDYAALMARAEQGSHDYTMATVWTVDRLHTFAELVSTALTEGTTAASLIGVAS